MATASGLVFFATTVDPSKPSTQKAEKLWLSYWQTYMLAMSYAVNGKQYVCHRRRSDVFSFALPKEIKSCESYFQRRIAHVFQSTESSWFSAAKAGRSSAGLGLGRSRRCFSGSRKQAQGAYKN